MTGISRVFFKCEYFEKKKINEVQKWNWNLSDEMQQLKLNRKADNKLVEFSTDQIIIWSNFRLAEFSTEQMLSWSNLELIEWRIDQIFGW